MESRLRKIHMDELMRWYRGRLPPGVRRSFLFYYTCDVKTTHTRFAELQAGAQVIESWPQHGNCKLPALPLLQQSGTWVTTDHLIDKVRRKDASASGSAPTANVVHVGERGAADFFPVAMAYRSY